MTTDPSRQSTVSESSRNEEEHPAADAARISDAAGVEQTAANGTTVTSSAVLDGADSTGPPTGPLERRKIQVGSRSPATRPADDTAQRADQPIGRKDRRNKPDARREKPVEGPPEELVEQPVAVPKVPRPSRRDKLPPELEDALDNALAGASMDELLGVAAPVSSEVLEVDSRHRATVVKIHGDNVFCSIDGRNQGVASLRQFAEPPEVGSPLDVVIRGFHADDGLYEVMVPGGAISVHDWSDLTEGAVVEARITGSNVGGLECMVGSIRGFIPASQIEVFRVEHYADYYEKKLPCVVTEANPRRRNLVLSHRALLEREREQQRQKLLDELDSGQIREGVVSSIRDFGAFVDLGGVEGLIHISQLSWDRINHPSEVLEAGQRVRVKVEKVNRETGKISLSYRDLLAHPWTDVEQRFPLNATVKGIVTRIAKFGAFVKIAPGIEGLIHISELAHHRVVQVSNVVKEGEEVEVKVVSVDEENQRIGLSLKAAHPLAEVAAGEEAEAEEVVDEPPQQRSVKPHQGPLRGGTDRTTGGEDIGLRW
jgi:small subunit ribosomal protein S1